MAGKGKEYPLSLVIRAIPKLAGLAALSKKLSAATDDVGAFKKGIGQITGFSKVASGFSGVGHAVKEVGMQAFELGKQLFELGAVAAIGLFAIVKSSADAGAELEKMAHRTGLSVDMYAQLQYAAGQADISQEQFNGGMEKFTKALGEATANSGPLYEFLMKVSPAMAEQIKYAKGTGEALDIMTDAFVRLKDPRQRAALADKAFGRSNAQFGEMLHEGSAAMKVRAGEYARLAGSQTEFAEGGRDTERAIRKLDAAFQGLRAAIMGALFPAFQKLFSVIAEFIAAHRDELTDWAEGAAKAMKEWIDGGGIKRVVDGIRDLISTVSRVIDRIGGFKTVLAAVGVFMAGPLIVSILAVIPALVTLGTTLLTTPFGWFLLMATLIGLAAFEIVKNWDDVKAFFKDFFPEFSKEVSDAYEGLKLLIEGVEKLNALRKEWVTEKDNEDMHRPKDQGTWADFKSDLSSSFSAKELWKNTHLGLGGLSYSPAMPALPGASGANGKVTVEFKNAPKGTRVTTESGDVPIDTATGYVMSGS